MIERRRVRLMARETLVATIAAIPGTGVRRSAAVSATALRREIDRADVVSFDVFDTVLVRDVAEPADAFFFLDDGDPVAARRARLAAEDDARRQAAANGWAEVTLPEIYGHATGVLADAHDPSGERRAAAEISVEQRLCQPLSSARAVVAALVDAGRPPMFVSDTYLAADDVATLLEENGFGEWSHLVVSSAHRTTKRDGGLFEIAAQHVAQGARWLHVGDTLTPDVLRPRQRGIRAAYVPRVIDRHRIAAGSFEGELRTRVGPIEASVVVGILARHGAAGNGHRDGWRRHARSLARSLDDPTAVSEGPSGAAVAELLRIDGQRRRSELARAIDESIDR